MPRAGKSFEKLVSIIETSLADSKNTTVYSPKYLPDKTTGVLREFDVVITIVQEHHTILVGIECRDRKSAVDVSLIESFLTKCQDTGIHHSIIVSSSGFTKPARIKANQKGIRCLDIEEAASFDWLLTTGVHLFNKKLLGTNWGFFLESDEIIDLSSFEILDRDGKAIDKSFLTLKSLEQMNLLLPSPSMPLEEDILRVKFDAHDLIIRNLKTGEQENCTYAIAEIHYSVVEEIVPFTFVKYIDKSDDQAISDAAVAKLNFGGFSGELVIVHNEDKGGKIYYVPRKEK
ncbi:MAG: hypothetical protein HOC71_09060 [Candidatus Latescibacteria bacterium]|jgi:hypothetical protein|nr:hypothetical protein [Candidatus Latescibacterota bacterium]